MKASDFVAILSVIVAVAGVVGAPQLEIVFPGHGAYLAGIISIAGLASAAIIRTLTNKTGAPAQSIIADAPVVTADTAVVTKDFKDAAVSTDPPGGFVGTNVSTSSTLPIKAAQKGTSE